MPTSEQKQHANGCRHFTGLQHQTCGAGLKYKDVLQMGTGLDPCRPSHLDDKYHLPCILFEFYPVEEIEQMEAEAQAAIKEWLEKLAKDICPYCDNLIVSRQQVGRCVYAYPCGHRLYQGNINVEESSDDSE